MGKWPGGMGWVVGASAFLTLFLTVEKGLAQTCVPSVSSASVGTLSLIPQINELSCWAAVGEMITAKRGSRCTQCAQLSRKCNLCTNRCCSQGAGNCEMGGFVDWGWCGFSASSTTNDRALTWDELRNQIGCVRSPIAFSWHWEGGGGHMMVAAKYKVYSGYGNWVYVYDPDPVDEGDVFWLDYPTYVEGEYHTHWRDDYNVKVVGE
ncbi:MAG: hypothetical protein IPK82_24930 [Polyangiaceae bacterium]|nr:hypothetical protein [Polyangiaceae bacterium]